MRPRFSQPLKSICLLLIGALLAEQVALAAPDFKPAQSQFFDRPTVDLRFPESVAQVEDSWSAGHGSQVVYLFQDAHANLSGQTNLSRALDHLLQKESGLRWIFMEGGFGDSSLSFLRAQATSAERRAVADRYIKKGLLHGEEHLDLSSDRPMSLWGVEDLSLYMQALEAYKNTAKTREHFIAYLGGVNAATESLKSALLNPRLLALDRQIKRYYKNEISVTDYSDALISAARDSNISTDDFNDLRLFSKLREAESKIDFKQASLEQAKAVFSLSESDRKEIAELSESANRSPFKVGGEDKEGRAAFYAALGEKLAGRTAGYPEFSKYLTYLESAKKVQAQNILTELSDLEKKVLAALSWSADERDLLRASEVTALYNKLFQLQMTPEEYRAYKTLTASFGIERATGFINKKIVASGIARDRALLLENGFEEIVHNAETFYDLTLRRDESMVKSALEKMEKENTRQAVLIAGGFHAVNLKTLLKEKRISFISIRPQILHETNQTRYEAKLFGQKLNPSLSLMAPALSTMRDFGLRTAAPNAGLNLLMAEPVFSGARLAARKMSFELAKSEALHFVLANDIRQQPVHIEFLNFSKEAHEDLTTTSSGVFDMGAVESTSHESRLVWTAGAPFGIDQADKRVALIHRIMTEHYPNDDFNLTVSETSLVLEPAGEPVGQTSKIENHQSKLDFRELDQVIRGRNVARLMAAGLVIWADIKVTDVLASLAGQMPGTLWILPLKLVGVVGIVWTNVISMLAWIFILDNVWTALHLKSGRYSESTRRSWSAIQTLWYYAFTESLWKFKAPYFVAGPVIALFYALKLSLMDSIPLLFSPPNTASIYVFKLLRQIGVIRPGDLIVIKTVGNDFPEPVLFRAFDSLYKNGFLYFTKAGDSKDLHRVSQTDILFIGPHSLLGDPDRKQASNVMPPESLWLPAEKFTDTDALSAVPDKASQLAGVLQDQEVSEFTKVFLLQTKVLAVILGIKPGTALSASGYSAFSSKEIRGVLNKLGIQFHSDGDQYLFYSDRAIRQALLRAREYLDGLGKAGFRINTDVRTMSLESEHLFQDMLDEDYAGGFAFGFPAEDVGYVSLMSEKVEHSLREVLAGLGIDLRDEPLTIYRESFSKMLNNSAYEGILSRLSADQRDYLRAQLAEKSFSIRTKFDDFHYEATISYGSLWGSEGTSKFKEYRQAFRIADPIIFRAIKKNHSLKEYIERHTDLSLKKAFTRAWKPRNGIWTEGEISDAEARPLFEEADRRAARGARLAERNITSRRYQAILTSAVRQIEASPAAAPLTNEDFVNAIQREISYTDQPRGFIDANRVIRDLVEAGILEARPDRMVSGKAYLRAVYAINPKISALFTSNWSKWNEFKQSITSLGEALPAKQEYLTRVRGIVSAALSEEAGARLAGIYRPYLTDERLSKEFKGKLRVMVGDLEASATGSVPDQAEAIRQFEEQVLKAATEEIAGNLLKGIHLDSTEETITTDKGVFKVGLGQRSTSVWDAGQNNLAVRVTGWHLLEAALQHIPQVQKSLQKERDDLIGLDSAELASAAESLSQNLQDALAAPLSEVFRLLPRTDKRSRAMATLISENIPKELLRNMGRPIVADLVVKTKKQVGGVTRVGAQGIGALEAALKQFGEQYEVDLYLGMTLPSGARLAQDSTIQVSASPVRFSDRVRAPEYSIVTTDSKLREAVHGNLAELQDLLVILYQAHKGRLNGERAPYEQSVYSIRQSGVSYTLFVDGQEILRVDDIHLAENQYQARLKEGKASAAASFAGAERVVLKRLETLLAGAPEVSANAFVGIDLNNISGVASSDTVYRALLGEVFRVMRNSKERYVVTEDEAISPARQAIYRELLAVHSSALIDRYFIAPPDANAVVVYVLLATAETADSQRVTGERQFAILADASETEIPMLAAGSRLAAVSATVFEPHFVNGRLEESSALFDRIQKSGVLNAFRALISNVSSAELTPSGYVSALKLRAKNMAAYLLRPLAFVEDLVQALLGKQTVDQSA